jgi:hypothetical protein
MKAKYWKWMSAAVLALSLVPGALAQCGLPGKPIKPAAWHLFSGASGAHLLRTGFQDFDDREPSIVGMWHVIFTAQTQGSQDAPIPGGLVIDNAVVVWHSDGTEIMNSARPAQDGNFCLGVWKHTGARQYFLNHIPWLGNVFDPTAPPSTVGPPQAGDQIIERITLSRDGDSYHGTFTLHAYDTSGNVYASFTGVLSAKRITVETPFGDLL